MIDKKVYTGLHIISNAHTVGGTHTHTLIYTAKICSHAVQQAIFTCKQYISIISLRQKCLSGSNQIPHRAISQLEMLSHITR